MADTPLSWLFVDMNSFFAAAEQHLRPELRGRPVGVIPVRTDHTCVIAASVQAKAFGVRTGTGVREARKLCPDIELVMARPDVYVSLHHEVARCIESCVPIHKAYSVDEWGVRLMGVEQEEERAVAIGARIQGAIRRAHSPALSCSVGIAPTRLLAKIGSDLRKPNGLTVLHPRDVPAMLAGRELTDLCGIGRGTAARLGRHGVRTVADLWALSRDECVRIWGSVIGGDWWAGFHGHDEPEMATRRSTMTHACVLDPKFRSEEGAREMLVRLITRLGVRMRENELSASGLAVFAEAKDKSSFSRSKEFAHTCGTPDLLAAFYAMWGERPEHAPLPMRVGATVLGLAPVDQIPAPLFEGAHQVERLSVAMDRITKRWGLSSLYVGSMHNCRHHMQDKIAFGRIPGGAGPN